MESVKVSSIETPSAERQPKPTGSMGLPFRRRFHMVRSGAMYQALMETEPHGGLLGRTYPPNRKALRDMVRQRVLKNSGRVPETHPDYVSQVTDSASSSPESDTPEQIADLIAGA